MNESHTVRVMVCGNTDRTDDGAAVRAVGVLRQRLDADRRRDVHIERCGQLDILHLLDVPAGQAVIIVDAAVGVRAGRVVTIPLDDLIDRPYGPGPHSSHALPINQVLGVVNALTGAPLRGLFVGIGALDFSFGDGLSRPVSRALPKLVDAIAAAIDQFAPLRAEVAGKG